MAPQDVVSATSAVARVSPAQPVLPAVRQVCNRRACAGTPHNKAMSSWMRRGKSADPRFGDLESLEILIQLRFPIWTETR